MANSGNVEKFARGVGIIDLSFLNLFIIIFYVFLLILNFILLYFLGHTVWHAGS